MKVAPILLALAACSESAPTPVISGRTGSAIETRVDPKEREKHRGSTLVASLVTETETDAPVQGALVRVLRAGLSTKGLDLGHLDGDVVSSGTSDASGRVILQPRIPFPGMYSVVVTAPGFDPVLGDDELKLGAGTPERFDPWGKIWLLRTRP